MDVNILCIGDIVGRPGRMILADHLTNITKKYDIDCVIANAENAAGGSGITVSIFDKLKKYGVNLVTMGDHIYRKRDIFEIMNNADNIVRPINLSPSAKGRQWASYTTPSGATIAVISVIGRMYMPAPADNPYHAIDRVLKEIPEDIKIIVVDMHAEVTSEKIAMGWHIDGRVSTLYGTHTHVATADERILPNGTGYITDVGMTAAHQSVLGRNIEPVLKSLTEQMPHMFSIATEDVRLNGIIVTVDNITGKTKKIIRLSHSATYSNQPAYDASDGRGQY
jgi:metallophosphoesterase (TIGR00282 family)